jgi:hypothetical protein
MMVSLYYVIQEMHSFSMRPAKYFYEKPLPKYIDPKTVLIYRQHPVCCHRNTINRFDIMFFGKQRIVFVTIFKFLDQIEMV